MSEPPSPSESVDVVVSDAAIRARVAKLVELGDPNRHRVGVASLLSSGLGKLVVGFLLTGLVGAWLSARFQEHADLIARAAEVREARRAQRLAELDSIASLLNEGYYAFGRYYDAKATSAPSDTVRVRAKAFAAFNERLEKREIKDAARICAEFGFLANHRYLSVDSLFHAENPRLRNLPAGPSPFVVAFGEEDLYGLRDSVFSLTLTLAAIATDTASAAQSDQCRPPGKRLLAGLPNPGYYRAPTGDRILTILYDTLSLTEARAYGARLPYTPGQITATYFYQRGTAAPGDALTFATDPGQARDALLRGPAWRLAYMRSRNGKEEVVDCDSTPSHELCRK